MLFTKKYTYISYSFVLITCLMLHFSNSAKNVFNFNVFTHRNTKNNLRRLSDDSDINIDDPIPKLIDVISFKNYQGSWKSMSNIFDFERKNGSFRFMFNIDTVYNSPHVIILMVLRDGQYIERQIYFQIDNPIVISQQALTNQTFNRTHLPAVINEFNYFSEELLQGCKLDLGFSFMNLNENKTFYPIVNGYINSKECGLEIEFETTMVLTDDSKKVTTLSIILFSFSIIYLIHSLHEFKRVNSNVGIAKKYSLIYISSNIIWDAFIAFGMFSIMLRFNLFEIYLIFSTIILFVSFTTFRIRTLLLIWRSQNLDLLVNFQLFRNRVLKFYVLFYIFLMLCLFFSSYIFTHNYILFFPVSLVWIPQIIKSIKVGKCVINFSTILIISFHRLFIPLYFRMCPNNVFSFETDLIFSLSCIFTIFFSIVLLLLQKLLGGKFFVPKAFLPKTYNYYRTIEELNLNENQKEILTCSICLGSLVSNDSTATGNNTAISEGERFFEKEKKQNVIIIKIKKIIEKFKIKSKEKPFMLTPCNHIFHSDCLKPWHEQKQDCPMCRLALPVLEEI